MSFELFSLSFAVVPGWLPHRRHTVLFYAGNDSTGNLLFDNHIRLVYVRIYFACKGTGLFCKNHKIGVGRKEITMI